MHIADLAEINKFDVRIEFTEAFEPFTLCGDGLPFVSVKDEIEANSKSKKGQKLKEKFGFIPYGAPLYIWESSNEERTQIEYIGQSMSLKIQDRFTSHVKVMQVLSKYINDANTNIYFRLCSRLDIRFRKNEQMSGVAAIEHFPFEQAKLIVDDIEAYLINLIKPPFNKHYKQKEKEYKLTFNITEAKNIELNPSPKIAGC